jgi:hypothetical protein
MWLTGNCPATANAGFLASPAHNTCQSQPEQPVDLTCQWYRSVAAGPLNGLAYDRSLSSDAGWGFPDQVASFRAAG